MNEQSKPQIRHIGVAHPLRLGVTPLRFNLPRLELIEVPHGNNTKAKYITECRSIANNHNKNRLYY